MIGFKMGAARTGCGREPVFVGRRQHGRDVRPKASARPADWLVAGLC